MTAQAATFGKYFLSEKIAIGGMAEIHLAKLIGPGGFEKQLVLKLIHPELSEHRQFVDMFVAEAKTLVSLTHGNIVPVYELGVVDGTYFLAMEYIDGPALASLSSELRAKRETFGAPLAAFITAELLKGLDYAHRKGVPVIHRDVSPRNVMLSREGEVKLVDFGLAVTELSQRGSTSELPAGSFPYMSPEQVRQTPLDPRTDLFSAGIILWEMLTGRYLFHRDTADATLDAVRSAPIPAPSSVESDVPSALDHICARALARDRDQRYDSASAFLSDLNRYLYGLDSPPTPMTLAQLVARRMPVKRRRSSRPSAGIGTAPVTAVAPRATTTPTDRTAPMPARGKDRLPTATFATHAAFEEVIAQATPLFPLQAIDALEELHAAPRGGDSAGVPAAEIAAGTSKTMAAPRRPWPVRVAGLLALVAAGVVLGLVLSSSPGGSVAAGVDGGSTKAATTTVSGSADAAPGGSAADAAADPAVAADAAPPAPPDAGPRAPVRHATDHALARGRGTLRVGARPWGEVYVDGHKVGQAPGQWVVSAGRHEVVVRFPVAGHEQSKTFQVDVAADHTASVGVVDFTGS